MPNINDVFPSRFLKAHDLKGHTPTVTIDRVAFEQVRGRTRTTLETVPVVYFRGHTKGLLLKKTNARALAQIAKSAMTEAWPGVSVTLYATTATFGTDTYDVIRLKAASVNQKQGAA